VLIKPLSHCPGIRPGASRHFAAGGPERNGTNRDGIRVRSYIPGSATDQARFGAQIDQGMSRLCYGLRRCIPGVEFNKQQRIKISAKRMPRVVSNIWLYII